LLVGSKINQYHCKKLIEMLTAAINVFFGHHHHK